MFFFLCCHIGSYYFQLSRPLFPPLCYVNTITRFSAEAGNFHFHSFTLSLIKYAAETLNVIDFLVPLRYDLDFLRCLPLSLFSPPIPPQRFIHLCPRLSFRVLRQGLLWSLSLPKRRRLWPHHWPVCLPNRLHWDELWAELSRPNTL